MVIKFLRKFVFPGDDVAKLANEVALLELRVDEAFRRMTPLTLGVAEPLYLGDPANDGSWRFVRSDSAGTLLVQRKIAGAWTTKGTF